MFDLKMTGKNSIWGKNSTFNIFIKQESLLYLNSEPVVSRLKLYQLRYTDRHSNLALY